MSHVELVQYIYEKFKHGDAQSILATFAPDVEFRLAEGHPYQPSGQPWCGKDTITQHFFRHCQLIENRDRTPFPRGNLRVCER